MSLSIVRNITLTLFLPCVILQLTCFKPHGNDNFDLVNAIGDYKKICVLILPTNSSIRVHHNSFTTICYLIKVGYLK